jgi:hypothetical protein
MDLILVGVVHRDPKGRGLLAGLLAELKPEAICLEMSPLGLVWRETQGPILKKRLARLLQSLPIGKRAHPHVQMIGAALGLPFEFLAARAHARRKRLPLHLVDLNWISREHLALYGSDIVTAKNLAILVQADDLSLEERVTREYRTASDLLSGGGRLRPGISPKVHDGASRLRERFLACRIRLVASRHRRVVHVGGWSHLIEDPEGRSMASHLKDLSPRRMLLSEARDRPL